MTHNDFTLSRSDMLKMALLTLLLPLPVNWALLKLNPMTLMDGADDAATWIGFGGSYIGGIIGGVISLLILNRTLQQTGMLHKDLKVLQLNTILYTQRQEWFVGFRTHLADNLKAIDLYVLNMVVSCLSMKDFAYAKTLLTEVNTRLEQQTVNAGFLFPDSVLLPQEQDYLDCMLQVCLEYSALVRDLLYYIPLAEALDRGVPIDYDTLMDYTMSQYDYLQESLSGHRVEDTLCSSVLELDPADDIVSALRQLVERRLTLRSSLYRLKAGLAQTTRQLIRFEEDRINAILKND